MILHAATSFLLVLPIVQDVPVMQSAELVELQRTDGTSVVAAIVRVDGDRVRLRMPVLGGHVEATKPLADFTPAARFRIEAAAVPPQGFGGHFAAARQAAELGLLADAGVHARAAAKALEGSADADAKRAELRTWGADAVEKAVRDAVAAGDVARARHALSILTSRLADQRTDEQLDAVAALVENAEQQRRQSRARQREAREAAATEAEADRTLDSIAERIARGDRAYHDALRKRSTTASTKLCEQALDHYGHAQRALQQLLREHEQDAHTDRALALAREVHDRGIAAALHAATMLGVQSDYRGALEWAQRVLAFDPRNAEAKELVRTLTIAEAVSADDLRWRWTIGDIGRVGVPPSPRDR